MAWSGYLGRRVVGGVPVRKFFLLPNLTQSLLCVHLESAKDPGLALKPPALHIRNSSSIEMGHSSQASPGSKTQQVGATSRKHMEAQDGTDTEFL